MQLPSGHILGPGAIGVHRAVGRARRRPRSRCPCCPVPRMPEANHVSTNLVVRARKEEPRQSAGPRSRHRDHHPGAGVAPAREAPAAGHAQPAARRLALSSGGIEAAGEERVRSGREELLLGPLGKVAEPPVVRGPQGVAPGRRPAATAELEAHVERRVHLDVVAAVAAGIADPDEAGRRGDPARSRRESGGAARCARARDFSTGTSSAARRRSSSRVRSAVEIPAGAVLSFTAPMLRRTRARARERIRRPGASPARETASAAPRGGRRRRSASESRPRRPAPR